VNFDPTSWTLISGSFVAAGGEDIMVLAGFENTGTMPFPYIYIDMVSVIAMPELNLSDAELCEETLVLELLLRGRPMSGAQEPPVHPLWWMLREISA
jgi:hypothetical protein